MSLRARFINRSNSTYVETVPRHRANRLRLLEPAPRLVEQVLLVDEDRDGQRIDGRATQSGRDAQTYGDDGDVSVR